LKSQFLIFSRSAVGAELKLVYRLLDECSPSQTEKN